MPHRSFWVDRGVDKINNSPDRWRARNDVLYKHDSPEPRLFGRPLTELSVVTSTKVNSFPNDWPIGHNAPMIQRVPILEFKLGDHTPSQSHAPPKIELGRGLISARSHPYTP
jgi:hypothetical protein